MSLAEPSPKIQTLALTRDQAKVLHSKIIDTAGERHDVTQKLRGLMYRFNRGRGWAAMGCASLWQALTD